MDVTTMKDALEVLKKGVTSEGRTKLIELEVLLNALHHENKNLKIENLALRQRLELLEEARMAKKPVRHPSADNHATVQ